MPEPPQHELFPADLAPTGAITINARYLVRTRDKHRVVLVADISIAHYTLGDAMAAGNQRIGHGCSMGRGG